jgi:hypothetical protein
MFPELDAMAVDGVPEYSVFPALATERMKSRLLLVGPTMIPSRLADSYTDPHRMPKNTITVRMTRSRSSAVKSLRDSIVSLSFFNNSSSDIFHLLKD